MDPTVGLDFIFNGQGSGDVASRIIQARGDIGALRPFIGDDGRAYMTLTRNGREETVMTNAPATLRYEQWRLIDETVVEVGRLPLEAVGDLRSRGLEYNLPNGMGNIVLSYENVGDISGAIISMDPARRSETDQPQFDMVNLPLPIIHKDCTFGVRQVLASQTKGNTGIDDITLRLAAIKVAEAAEDLLLGVLASYAYGGYSVYGYTNHPNRLTKTLTKPTAVGWTPATTYGEVISMLQNLQDHFHYGPYVVYMSPNWFQYTTGDYSAAKGDDTLLEKLQALPGVQSVRTIPRLSQISPATFTIIIAELNGITVREVIGEDMRTVQWETHGGFIINYKVLAMLIPQFRMDQNLNLGVNHGAIAA